MNFYQIGNLTVPVIWIATVAALFIASLLNRIFTGKKTSEWFWNGFFLYFLVWKLSYIVFHFELFWKMPLSILYFNGGKAGHVIALAALSFYATVLAPKKYPSLAQEAPRLVLLFFISYETLNNLLQQNVLAAFCHFILLGGFLFLLRFLKKNGNALSGQLFLLFMLLELLMLSIFQSIFSWETLTFVWLGLTASFLSKNIMKEKNTIE